MRRSNSEWEVDVDDDREIRLREEDVAYLERAMEQAGASELQMARFRRLSVNGKLHVAGKFAVRPPWPDVEAELRAQEKADRDRGRA